MIFESTFDELESNTEAEASKTLLARVGRKSPKIPADLLVRHVLRVVPSSEWPVRVEAFDGLLRRVDSVKKEGLRIEARPSGGAPLGIYATRKRGSGVRPYATALFGVDPIEARCDCLDFLENPLGLCKHALAVLEFLHDRPKVLCKAMLEGDQARPALLWDPIRPLEGPGDWLARVTFSFPPDANPPKVGRVTRALKWFRLEGEGTWVVADSHLDDPLRRYDLVLTLGKLAPRDPSLVALLGLERDRLRTARRRAMRPQEIREAWRA